MASSDAGSLCLLVVCSLNPFLQDHWLRWEVTEGASIHPHTLKRQVSPQVSGSVCVRVWFVASVARAFEKNDFFDTGITKAQLFLTLHDAVLFALSRRLPESSELKG